METIKKWLWQHEEYPNFNYDQSALVTLRSKVSRNTGYSDGYKIDVAKYRSDEMSVSIATAKRDITGLVDSGLIEQVEGSAGRNVCNIC